MIWYLLRMALSEPGSQGEQGELRVGGVQGVAEG